MLNLSSDDPTTTTQADRDASLFFSSLSIPASVILTRMASKLRKETGKEYRSKAEQSRPPMLELIRLSVSRPFVMLFTEPVVALYSLWVGFGESSAVEQG